MHEEPLIENIIEDPLHVTQTDNSDDWECFHDYFNDDDHICTPNLPQDETITKAYNETYDESCNVHDGTPTCSPYNDDSMDGFMPCDLFSEEDEYEEEEKYILEHDTSDEYSLMSDKDVDEDCWTFMENPIYDIFKEENNEPETFDGFVDNSVYAISN